MRLAILTRSKNFPYAQFGDWVSDSGFTCKTLERPWLDNAPDVSCIPPAPTESLIYQVKWMWSPAHGKNLYQVQGVDARSGIEIHSANIAPQLEGCIAVGRDIELFPENSIGQNPAQYGVTLSLDTLAQLEKDMRDENGNQVDFELTIKWQ